MWSNYLCSEELDEHLTETLKANSVTTFLIIPSANEVAVFIES